MSSDFVVGLFMVGTIFIMAVILFFVFRVVVLWYFRLNQIADNLAVIADHYRQMGALARTPASPRPPQAPSINARQVPSS